jgi:hypothetical protein
MIFSLSLHNYYYPRESLDQIILSQFNHAVDQSSNLIDRMPIPKIRILQEIHLMCITYQISYIN